MKSALFVHGGWEGHEPEQCISLLAPRLEAAGYSLRIHDSMDVFDDPETLSQLDVISVAWTMGELSKQRTDNIRAAVEAGTGLAGWHGGMADAFRGNTDWQFMTGAAFLGHPGNFIDYTVRVTDPSHPITQGLPEQFDVHSEQYYMAVDPGVSVIAETPVEGPGMPWIQGVTMPVVWHRQWNKGRVAISALGHNAEDLAKPEALTLAERCIRWAAREL